ncbi:MAG: hypothetical protein AMXMBFR58_36120 [Phycisphaerae bacterium]
MDPQLPPNEDPLLRSIDEIFAAPPEQRPRLAHSLFGNDPELLAQVLEAISGDRLGTLAAEVRGLYRASRPVEEIVDGQESDRVTVGRYRLLEKLGEGGFGEVYVAEQREPMRRLVAVKIVKAGMDSRVVIARFEAERQALALMDHPNIARVFDGGATDAGRPYFVMELVRGIPITDYCDRHQLGVRERLDLAIQVCHAVQHAHQKGIIHRDLKPANVLVTLVDAKPVPKVIDFGIAKAVETPLTDKTIYTEFRQFVGSPAYMSPERIGMSGQDVDTRSDIYSLGVLIYELLTGSTPFDTARVLEGGLLALHKALTSRPPTRPSEKLSTLTGQRARTVGAARAIDLAELVRSVRGELDAIVTKALEHDRRRRYDTAESLAADLTRYLRGEPVRARPPSRLYVARKFVQRHRVAVGALVTIAVCLVGGLGAATWGFLAASAARDQAREAQATAEAEAILRREHEESARRREYDAVTTLAAEMLDRGSSNEARTLLESTPVDLRGWEWFHLDTISRGTMRTADAAAQAVIDEAARLAAQAASRGPPDVTYGALCGVIDGPDPERVYASHWLSSLTLRGERRGIFLRARLPAWADYRLCRLSTDGSLILVSFSDGSLLAGPVSGLPVPPLTAELTLPRLLGGSAPVKNAAFSSDSTTLIAQAADGTLVEWPLDAQTGVVVFPSNQTVIMDSVLSPDARTIYLACWGLVRAVDAATGCPRWTTCFTSRYVDTVIQFDEGRKLLTIGHNEQTAEIGILDATTGTLEHFWSARPDADLPITPGSPLLKHRASAAIDLTGHAGPRIAFALNDGTWTALSTVDQSVQPLTLPEWPQDARLVGVKSSGRAVAMWVRHISTGNPPQASTEQTVLVYDAGLERVLFRARLPRVLDATCSPDGSRIVVVDAGGDVSLWSIAEGRRLWTYRMGAPGRHVAWISHADRPRVVASDSRGRLIWLDADRGSRVLTRSGFRLASALHPSTDGAALLVGTSGHDVIRLESRPESDWFAQRAAAARAERSLAAYGPTKDLRDHAINHAPALSSADRDWLLRVNRGRGDDINMLHSAAVEQVVGESDHFILHRTLPVARMLALARPGSARVHITRALCELRTGDIQQAAVALDRAQSLLDRAGLPRGFWHELALARLRHAQHDPTLATEHLEAARAAARSDEAITRDRLSAILLRQTENLLTGRSINRSGDGQ